MLKMIIAGLFVFISSSAFSFDILAKSWLIADGDGNVLESENINIQQPIASITKLMTVMVVLDSNDSLNQTYKIRGVTVTRHKLIDLAIIHSDNQAADMLCKTYRRGYSACIQEMNHKAQVIGMSKTEFHDSTGLDNRNVSTPLDLIKLLQAAEKYPAIVNASNQTIVELLSAKKRRFTKWTFSNTNPLVAKYNVVVSKTGYVRLSGGCLVMTVMIKGEKRLFVVLNSRTTRTRIHDMEQLIVAAIEKST